jgi:CBS domain-containing protein
MNRETALPTYRLSPHVSLAQAAPWRTESVRLDSPALEVMTDLTLVKAATTHPETTLQQAEQMMIFQGVRMLFVVTDMPSIEGLVTASDLRGDRPLQIVHERRLRFDELAVGDVMTPVSMLDALDFASLRNATVRNLVKTLERNGRHHLLVVEESTAHTPRRVRGVVSRSQIERQLGQPIAITPIASSFSEIERALA